MIILNTTFQIDKSVETEVLDWIRRAYAASAVKSGADPKYLLTHILAQMPDGGEAYALHLSFPTLAEAQDWDNGVASKLRSIMAQRWGEKALSFQTYMEVIDG